MSTAINVNFTLSVYEPWYNVSHEFEVTVMRKMFKDIICSILSSFFINF